MRYAIFMLAVVVVCLAGQSGAAERAIFTYAIEEQYKMLPG